MNIKEDYEGQAYLLYSKYGGDHSDVYGIPIDVESHIEPLQTFDFSSWDGTFPETALTSGSEESNPANRTNLSKLNLSPYFSPLTSNSSPRTSFRFLYTGRELNIETGNYYYRARIMDSTTGRFTSKDPILYLNLYRSVKNNPTKLEDPFGKNFIKNYLRSVEDLANTLKRLGILIGDSTDNGAVDNFEHCYTGCQLSKSFGGLSVKLAEQLRETFSSSKDKEEDIRSTNYGIQVAKENGNCEEECTSFNNMLSEIKGNEDPFMITHTNICGFDIKSTPGEASQQ